MAESVITYDLYKVLNLDRAWDCKTIKKSIMQEQSLWVKRSGSTNDTKQLMLIEERLKLIEEGIKHLIKDIKRKIYDEALDKAYKAGTIKDEIEEKLKDILAQAKAYYRKGNIKMASKLAQEAIDGKIGDASAYELLARCYYDSDNPQRALEIIDNGTKVFSNDLNLLWLGARYATIGTKNYDDAQKRINVLLEKAPNSAIGYSEQAYLHLHKGEEQLAFSEIDTYISSHPDDASFKKNVSYDMVKYARDTCYKPASEGGFIIASKEDYQRNLNLCAKAEEIYKDEYTERMLETAQYFGQKEWDSWNTESVKTLSIYGALFLILGAIHPAFAVVGGIFLAIDALTIYFSFQPYYIINRNWINGQRSGFEKILHTVASKMADWSYKLFHGLIRTVWELIKLAFKWMFGMFSN